MTPKKTGAGVLEFDDVAIRRGRGAAGPRGPRLRRLVWPHPPRSYRQDGSADTTARAVTPASAQPLMNAA